MPTLEANKAIVRDFLKAIDLHDRAAVYELLHEDHRLEYPGNEVAMDRDGHWRLICGYHEAFPDMRHRPTLQVAEADHVVTRGLVTGTNTGPLQGAPPTGRSTEVAFMNLAKIVDGQICGLFSLLDGASLQEQLAGGHGLYREGETATGTAR